MAAQKTVSILGKLGVDTKAAAERAKTREVKRGFTPLPAGLRGTARLVKCAIEETDKGVSFQAQGSILSPETFGENGTQVKVSGRLTQQFIPVTKETAQAASDRIVDVLRGLAGDEFVINSVAKIGIEETCKIIAATNPPIKFKYRTSMGKASGKIDPKTKQPYPPKLWENWDGYVEDGADDHAADPTSAFNDESGDTDNGSQDAVDPDEVDNSDVDSLITRAQNKDQSAMDRLRGMAIRNGWDGDEFDQSDWDTSRNMVMTPKDDAEPPPDDDDKLPVIGKTTDYAPPHPTAKGKRLKKVSCEVSSVNITKKTVVLKNLADDKVKYKDVPWDDITY